jgi:nucleoid-associated protein YgaU
LPPTPTPESGGHQATPVVIEPKHSGAEPAKEQPKDAPQAIIPPEFTDYTVKDGDTFTSIARHYYGSDALASAIIAANPLMSPDHLKPGRVIKIPKDPNNVQGIPVKQATPAPQTPLTPPTPPAPAAPAGARTYVVQPGDSLSKIAKEVYGDLRLSALIFEANRDQLSSEDAIKPGQTLKIPPRPAR